MLCTQHVCLQGACICRTSPCTYIQMGTREPATQVQHVWGCALGLCHQLCSDCWIYPEGGRQEHRGCASDPHAPWLPPKPSNGGAAGEMSCYVTLWYTFFCTGPGPSFPQESQSLGAAISPVPQLALLETGRGHEHLFQQQGKAPRVLAGDDGLLHQELLAVAYNFDK